MQEYIRVEIKITEFDTEDVITTSGGSDTSDTVSLPTPDEDNLIWGTIF